jgi:ankyrin repeat protein
VNWEDGDGMTSLHWAAMAGNKTIVRILLGSKAKIESEDYTGRTALHYAAAEGHEKVVRELLRRGANIEADNDGKTPLHCAVGNGHVEVVIRLLLENSSNSQSTRAKVAAVSALQGTDEVVAWWIKYGPKRGVVNCNGDTMLHWATSKGQITVVQVLLEKCIDIEAKNHRLETALNSAANAGHEAAARLLLDSGLI